MWNQLKVANQKAGPLLDGQVHDEQPRRTEVEETRISCGEDISDRGVATIMNKRSKMRGAREKAIVWLLKWLGCSRRNTTVDGADGAVSKWYNVKWKKGDIEKKTNVGHGDRLDEEDTSNRSSKVSCSNEIFDDFEREAYIGRRTSIGSVERNDAMILFNILDDLKDFKDAKKTKVNLGRLQRHILARHGDSS